MRTFVASLLVALTAAPAFAQGQTAAPRTVMTEFDPRLDGLPFRNSADFGSPGTCFAMVLMAIDNYNARVAAERDSGRPGAAPQFTNQVHQGNHDEQVTAGVLHRRAIRDGDNPRRANPYVPVAAAGVDLEEALGRIAATGQPEVLTFYVPGVGGHAVAVYGHRDGALQVYDPNFPGEAIAWPYDRETGTLGPHPKASLHPIYTPHEVASTPADQFHAFHDIDRLREACAANEAICTDEFLTIDVAATTDPEGAVTVSGRVTQAVNAQRLGDAWERPARMWAVVNGKPVAMAPVASDGTFSIPFAPGMFPADAEVKVVAVSTGNNLGGVRLVPPVIEEVSTSTQAEQQTQGQTVQTQGQTAPASSRGTSRGLVHLGQR